MPEQILDGPQGTSETQTALLCLPYIRCPCGNSNLLFPCLRCNPWVALHGGFLSFGAVSDKGFCTSSVWASMCCVLPLKECSNRIQHPLGLDSWFCHLVTAWTWQSHFTNPSLCFPLWSRITSPCPEWAEERSKWNNLESLACLNHFGFHKGPFYLFTYFWLCWVFVALRRAWATVCCGAQASHCSGFSCCGTKALGLLASVVAALSLGSYDAWV